MKWLPCRRRRSATAADVVDRAHAENRLRSVEKRADSAVHAILARNDRNHWTETIRQTIREERA